MSILNGPTTVTAATDIVISNLLGSGATTITVQATGGASVTGSFQVSNDGTNWVGIQGSPLPTGSATGSIAGDGFWVFAVAGMRAFRIHITAITGTEVITVGAGP